MIGLAVIKILNPTATDASGDPVIIKGFNEHRDQGERLMFDIIIIELN